MPNVIRHWRLLRRSVMRSYYKGAARSGGAQYVMVKIESSVVRRATGIEYSINSTSGSETGVSAVDSEYGCSAGVPSPP